MTIATAFDNWQDFPSPGTHAGCSPNLALLMQELARRYPGFHSKGCFQRRPIRGGEAPSSHWNGAAIDAGFPIEMNELVAEQVCPWLVARSGELHLQAIHDYRRRRIWRAGRTDRESDACGAWWKVQRASGVTGMGQVWANHLHLETTAGGWGDDVPCLSRWSE